MKKLKNRNVSLIDRYFANQMKDLKRQIEINSNQIKTWKKNLLTPWFKTYHENRGNSEKETDIHNTILRILDMVKGEQKYKKEMVEKYIELKKLHKTIHRAMEERWMDGFAEGVQFARESDNQPENI